MLRSLIDRQQKIRQQGASKLYYCSVHFNRVWYIGPRAMLWQMLEDLDVCGRILDGIKSVYAHGSAVRSSQGLSAIGEPLGGEGGGLQHATRKTHSYMSTNL